MQKNEIDKLNKKDLQKYIQKLEEANDEFVDFTTNVIASLIIFILISLFFRMWGWG